MSVLVFANIGTRDIHVPSQEKAPPPREYGARLLGDYAAVAEKLTLPIIAPALKAILAQVTQIDRLILIGTDQADARYQATDTLYYAQLAQRWIEINEPRVVTTAVELLQGINPSQFEETYDAYGTLLSRYTQTDISTCYLLASGGIPACNTNLMLHGVRFFGESCAILYTSPDGSVSQVQIGARLIAAMREASAVNLLQQYRFDAAYELLAGQSPETPPDARSLWQEAETAEAAAAQLETFVNRVSDASLRQQAAHNLAELQQILAILMGANRGDRIALTWLRLAKARLNMDYLAAEKQLASLSRLVNHSKDNPNQRYGQLQSQIGALAAGAALPTLGELEHNARIARSQEKMVDFFWLLAQFYTVALQYIADIYYPEQINPQAAPSNAQIVQSWLETTFRDDLRDTWLTPEQLTRLRMLMVEVFNLEELKSLMVDLGIVGENISGDNLEGKIRELIEYARRTGRVGKLIEHCQELRPAREWDELTAAHRILEQLTPCLTRLKEAISTWQRVWSAELPRQDLGPLTENGEESLLNDLSCVCAALACQTANPYEMIRAEILRAMRQPDEATRWMS